MKFIIIATTNLNKFEQISSILSALKVNNSRFLNLADLQITSDDQETGTVLNRAKQKALSCLSQIKPEDYSKYSSIIANDTGTILPTLNIKTPDSKKIASQILVGKLLKPGDPIHYLYNYAIILLPSKKIFSVETEIPFIYLGNPRGIKSTDGQNTMNMVKALPGQNIPHNQIPDKEVIKYRLKFLKKAFEPVIRQINMQS